MTTVSVQPTTSEPNERDIPTMSQFIDARDCFLAREKWYQDRIESLQAKLNEKDNFIKLMDVFGGYEKLQAKLNVAVNSLEYYADHNTGINVATEALAEINRIGE